jgi:outer membrane protein
MIRLFLSVVWTMVLLFSLTAQAESLIDIYGEALNADPELAAAEAKRDSVLELKPQSLALLLPNLTASAGANRIRQHRKSSPFKSSIGLEHYDQNSFSLDLLQPVYHHDYWVKLSQADSFVAQAEAEYQAARQVLIFRSAESYFAVLSAQDELLFATAEKEAISRQLEQAKERFEVGLIAITDVHEAQAGFDQARAGEILAINEVDNSWEALYEIINRRPSDLAPLAEKIPLERPEPMDIESWRMAALEGNLELVAARAGTKATRENISLQRSGHLPTLDIVGSVALSDTNQSIGSRTDTRTIGLQLNVPIFEGGAVNSRTRQAQHDFQEAQMNQDKTLRLVVRRVKDSFRGVLTSISQVKALHAAVISSESALEATEAGFEVGTRTMVDVLAEQRNLFRAKRDYSRARYDYILNGLKLKQAAGSLARADLEEVSQLLNQ